VVVLSDSPLPDALSVSVGVGSGLQAGPSSKLTHGECEIVGNNWRSLECSQRHSRDIENAVLCVSLRHGCRRIYQIPTVLYSAVRLYGHTDIKKRTKTKTKVLQCLFKKIVALNTQRAIHS